MLYRGVAEIVAGLFNVADIYEAREMKTKIIPAALGIDIGGTNIKSGLCDFKGNILTTDIWETPVKCGRDAIIEIILDRAQTIRDGSYAYNCNVVVVGVGSPGVIDIERGVVLGNTPNIPNWKGVNLRKIVGDKLDLICTVDNDANLFLLAESRYGAAKGHKKAIGLTIGTGIGGAIIIDGKLYRGSHYSAGEIGHIPIVADGIYCKCGRRGCLEAYASAPALVKQYSRFRGIDRKADAAGIFKRAKEKDPIADDAVHKWCEYLACGIASAVNLLNPEVVVLGGGVAEAGEFLRKRVADALRGKVLLEAYKGLKIKVAKLGNNAGWLGAATQAILFTEDLKRKKIKSFDKYEY